MLTRTAIESARAHAETFFSMPAATDPAADFRRTEDDALRAKTDRLRMARLAAEASRAAPPSRTPRRRAA